MSPKTPPTPLKGAPAAPLSPRASQQGWLWTTSPGTGSPLSRCSPDFLLGEHFFLDSQAYLMTASPALAESPALLQPPAFFFFFSSGKSIKSDSNILILSSGSVPVPGSRPHSPNSRAWPSTKQAQGAGCCLQTGILLVAENKQYLCWTASPAEQTAEGFIWGKKRKKKDPKSLWGMGRKLGWEVGQRWT